MSVTMRIFWLVTLMFFVGGCSGFKQVGTPRLGPEDPYHDIVGMLDIGDLVRLTLEDGTSLTGKVTERTFNFLTIELTTEPFDRQEIQVHRIFILEKENRGPSTGHVMIGILAVTLFVVMVSVTLGDWNGGFDRTK